MQSQKYRIYTENIITYVLGIFGAMIPHSDVGDTFTIATTNCSTYISDW